jgi:hypothetical protein
MIPGYQGAKKGKEFFELSWSKGVRDGRVEAQKMDWRANVEVIKVPGEMLQNPSDQDLLCELTTSLSLH